jgi:outer membrane lipoprotein carrier protein
MKTYSADFTQTVLGGRNQVLHESHGSVRIAQPNRFRWEVNEPYPQTLVTVADKLYLYDPDLQQLTIEPLAQALEGTPALILAGSLEDLPDQFEISEFSDRDAQAYSLFPKAEDALFAEIRLRFDSQNRLSHLEILDHLGQLTQVRFDNIEQNRKIAGSVFEFEVPAGTDIIGMP